jgi:ABC-type histidine transport system ATPase subunit
MKCGKHHKLSLLQVIIEVAGYAKQDLAVLKGGGGVEHQVVGTILNPNFGRNILISGCSGSAKFAFITWQNLLTPPQRGLAPPGDQMINWQFE